MLYLILATQANFYRGFYNALDKFNPKIDAKSAVSIKCGPFLASEDAYGIERVKNGHLS